MFKKIAGVALLASVFATSAVQAHEHGDAATARAFLKEISADSSTFQGAKGTAFFQELAKGQHPRATVVTCSDSRVHTNMLDKTPEGDLFMVRNIGNQIATAKGSVEYGINHLGSSLLLIIGHSKCGAITAASGDYSKLEPAIKKELDTIEIKKGVVNIDGVKTNVNNQVAAAVEEYEELVKERHLVIIGAVYDFADDMKQGSGKLNLINVNGKTDPAKIQAELTPSDIGNETDPVDHSKHH
ncbi:MAG: carbonic anhydrase [Nitrosomonadales bacterium]|nr:carbonic anhydrase [Nitrosomonadales bacterium]